MQYVQPCTYCGGIIKSDGNEWQCKKCHARWTLAMRLIDEGSVASTALDDIFGAEENTAPTLSVDTIHHYTPPVNSIRARCRLRIYHRDGHDIVILSEQPGNPGMSVTNAVMWLVEEISEEYGLEEDATFIEHYEANETYDLILPGPTWQRMAVEEVERITGDFFGALAPDPADLATLLEL